MKNVRTLREKKGLTQEQLATLMKVNVRTVQRFEQGHVRECYKTDLKRILS